MAGNRIAISTTRMAMTTSNSIRVKPRRAISHSRSESIKRIGPPTFHGGPEFQYHLLFFESPQNRMMLSEPLVTR